MDPFHGLLYGLSRAVEPQILILGFLGCLWGTMVGVLPGIGPVAGITILMPFTFGMDLTPAMVMMAGIYYGAMYGGSTTSILVAVPGETSSIVTILDGHQMAKQGRAGAALALSAIGSFVAGTVGILGLTFLAPPLAELAIGFGPPEYFALALVGLSMSSFLSNASLAKGLAMAVVGLIIGTVGLDIISGAPRFTFNNMELAGGLEIVSILIGLYGISEVMEMMAGKIRPQIRHEKLWNLHRLLPNRLEWSRSIWPIIRGSLMGFFVGALPGAGSNNHLSMVLLSKATGLAMTHVPFGSSAEGVNAVIGGNVDIASTEPPSAVGPFKEGRANILAILSTQRLDLIKEVPTVKEQGIDLVFGGWNGILAPKGTPKDIIDKLAETAKKALGNETLIKNSATVGRPIEFLSGPEFGERIKRELARNGEIIKAEGLAAK